MSTMCYEINKLSCYKYSSFIFEIAYETCKHDLIPCITREYYTNLSSFRYARIAASKSFFTFLSNSVFCM